MQQQQRNNRPSHSAVAKTRSSKATPVVAPTPPDDQNQLQNSYQQQLRGVNGEDDKGSRPAYTLKLDSSQSCIEELKFGA